MPETRTTRRLAAILAADVVGYSRLMAADEAGTHAALKRHREIVFDPTVAANNGRIVKLIGDGTLVEFSSVVDAVNCALAIQRLNAGASGPGPAITLRIGVNLGDVIIDGDDIYGDGVNIAARMEPLAEPGGVCIAAIVNESIGSRIDVKFEDAGEVAVKNIDRPIRVWKWRPNGSAGPATAAGAAPPPPVPKAQREIPSVAVLPFTNMSGDPEQEYFSDGISEDIITDLSKIAGLKVIARNSTFAYKGRNVDIRTVGRELGVRSVLEGSIRKAGNRVRITGQLIDAESGSHLWAERYDRELTDIFEVQDEVTKRIVDALKVKLTPREQALLSAGATSVPEAHDLLLRARRLLLDNNKNRATFEQIVELVGRAIALDPDYAEAHAALGMTYSIDYNNRWSDDPDGSLKKARACAEKAIAVDPDNPFGHYVASVVLSFMRDLDASAVEAEKALALSPNYGLAVNSLGVTSIYRGDSARAIAYIERAVILDPSFAQQYVHFLGLAHYLLGHYETAAAHFRERVLLAPETDFSRAYLAAAYGQLGRIDEAKQVWAELKQVNPKYSAEEHLARLPFRNRADANRIREGLAKAGLN